MKVRLKPQKAELKKEIIAGFNSMKVRLKHGFTLSEALKEAVSIP